MNPTASIREAAIDWLLRLRDAPDDDELKSAFEEWLRRDASHADAYRRVRCLMGDASRLLASDPDFIQKATRGRRGPTPGALSCLAGAVLIICTAFFAFDGPVRLRADAISGTGERRTLQLSDGSSLMLNAHSAIALRFGQHERRVVVLRGEVFVNVVPDEARPFVVEAGNGTATALGTAFDVDLAGNGASVTVIEHSVRVETGGEQVKLEENQRVTYDENGRIGAPQEVDPESATAWRHGRLTFENRPLEAVMRDLERYLPGRIVIVEGAIGARRVTGSFDLSDPQSVLDDMARAFNVGVTRLGPYLTLLHR